MGIFDVNFSNILSWKVCINRKVIFNFYFLWWNFSESKDTVKVIQAAIILHVSWWCVCVHSTQGIVWRYSFWSQKQPVTPVQWLIHGSLKGKHMSVGYGYLAHLDFQKKILLSSGVFSICLSCLPAFSTVSSNARPSLPTRLALAPDQQ